MFLFYARGIIVTRHLGSSLFSDAPTLRSVNQVYQNTTGQTIFITIYATAGISTSDVKTRVLIGNTNNPTTVKYLNGTTYEYVFTVPIFPGQYYKVAGQINAQITRIVEYKLI